MTMGMIEELKRIRCSETNGHKLFWSSLGLSGSDALFEVAAFWTYHTDYKHWRYLSRGPMSGIYSASKFALEGMK